MDPQFECKATASLLRSGRTLALAAHAAAIFSGFHLRADLFMFASLFCWCAAIYLAFRIRIDEALFELLSEDPALAPARLDQFLATHHLRKSKTQRNITDRCRGAIRLWRSLVGIILIQFATLALATLPRLQ